MTRLVLIARAKGIAGKRPAATTSRFSSAFHRSTDAGKLSAVGAIVGLCLCKIALAQVERFSQPARGERFWGIAASCTTRTSESSGSRGAPCG